MRIGLRWDDDLGRWEWRDGVPGPAGTCEIDILDALGRSVATLTFDAMDRSRLLRVVVDSLSTPGTTDDAVRPWLGSVCDAIAGVEQFVSSVDADLDEAPLADVLGTLGNIARLLEDADELAHDDLPDSDLLRSVLFLELVEQVDRLDRRLGCGAAASIGDVEAALSRGEAKFQRRAVAEHYGEARSGVASLSRDVVRSLETSPCERPWHASALQKVRWASERLVPGLTAGTESVEAEVSLPEQVPVATFEWSADGSRAVVEWRDVEEDVRISSVVSRDDADQWTAMGVSSRPHMRIWALTFDSLDMLVGAGVQDTDDEGRFTISLPLPAADVRTVYVGPNPRRETGRNALDVLRLAIASARAALHLQSASARPRAALLWWDAAHRFASVEAFSRATVSFKAHAALTADPRDAERSSAEARVWHSLAGQEHRLDAIPYEPFVWERLRGRA